MFPLTMCVRLCADEHGPEGHAFEQAAVDGPLQQPSHWMAGRVQSTDSAVGFVDSSAAVHRSRAGYASIDEQLYEWDEFWRSSTKADPMRGDWSPH